VLFGVIGAGSASAHPLGNFTVNHYDGLRLFVDRVQDLAVVDTAEIPTLQQKPQVDADQDGRVSDRERSQHAATSCAALAAALDTRLNDRRLSWTVTAASFGYRPGAANLQVSRLECRLTAAASLNQDGTLSFVDGYQSDRLGWREITAVGEGVRLVDSPVPAASVSRELLSYPNDLLSSPLDVRSAELRIRPGAGLSTFAAAADLPVAGPVARALNRLSLRFEGLVGADRLTLTVGLLALLLSLLLGASHAAMPGHGKTVIAAYIAGRRGSVRDALTVGATVTVTHTAGVIVLGLLLSAVATLAGDQVLGLLGLASGVLIAGIGGWLLRPALRGRVGHDDHHHHDHDHHDGDHHDHDDHDHDDHDHDDDDHPAEREPQLVAVTSAASAAEQPLPGRVQDHGHGHGQGHVHGHGFGHSHSRATADLEARGPLGRAGLVGMGIAGGLVPSPSALVVLLGAISLGRTAFGVLLVLCYGLGMAGTLTAVGLLLVHLRGRLDQNLVGRVGSAGAKFARLAPLLTATLVLVVGLGLAARSLFPLL
jgi:ABC-type nickel/cobalt efflux system permease component RcnA